MGVIRVFMCSLWCLLSVVLINDLLMVSDSTPFGVSFLLISGLHLKGVSESVCYQCSGTGLGLLKVTISS